MIASCSLETGAISFPKNGLEIVTGFGAMISAGAIPGGSANGLNPYGRGTIPL